MSTNYNKYQLTGRRRYYRVVKTCLRCLHSSLLTATSVRNNIIALMEFLSLLQFFKILARLPTSSFCLQTFLKIQSILNHLRSFVYLYTEYVCDVNMFTRYKIIEIIIHFSFNDIVHAYYNIHKCFS